MKIKSKIVLFVCAFALIFSVLSVSCFAISPLFSPGDSFTFVEFPALYTLDGSFVTLDLSGSISLGYTDPDNFYRYFTNFVVEEGVIRIYDDYQNFSITFDGEWQFYTGLDSVSISPPTFVVLEWGNFGSIVDDWFAGNSISSSYSSDSFYYNLYSSISDGVFGVGASLSSEQVMTLTLISTVLSYAFILLPLLFVIGFVLRCFRL